MKALKILQSKSKYFYLLMILFGMMSSVMYGGILFFINQIIGQKPLPYFPEYGWLLYLIILVASFVISKVLQSYMISTTGDIIYRYEISILQRLRFASFQNFEKIDNEKIYTAVWDARVLGSLPEVFINLVKSLIVVVYGTVYLFWVSIYGELLVLGLMTGLLVFYIKRNNQIEPELNRLRDMQDEYYGYVKELLLGFREIKMSTARNDTLYHQYIKDNRLKSKILGTKTAIKNIDNELMGSYSWYVVVGVILFALPRFYNVSVVDVASFVITVLFLMNPISILLNNIPFFNRLKIALERINALEEEFNTGALVLTPESRIDASLYQGRYAGTVEKVETISFRDVTYEHLDKEKKSKFVLGPVNLTINRGELVFITGGNGSGKSTFAHLLVGLYRPLEGGVYLNGELVTDADCQGYTSQVSVIFSNNYLFARNYDDFDLVSTNPEYLRYIRMMRLGEVIKFDDKRKWVDVNLSRGQQKRLALILALMENREVLVLDEWAAEQDPEFRQYFYKNLLPMLRDMGKTVIVITHDDKYFHCGDRTIRFDSGRIVSDVGVVPQEQTVN